MGDVLQAGGNKATLDVLKEKLISCFNLSDIGEVSQVLGCKSPVTSKRIARHYPGGLYQGNAGQVRHARLYAVGDAGYGKELSNRNIGLRTRRRSGYSNYCRRRHVPQPSDTLRHLVRREPTREGNVQPSKVHIGAAKHLLWYRRGSVNFGVI